MKKFLPLSAFLLMVHICFSQAWQWARTDNYTWKGNAICTDGLGHCYVAADSNMAYPLVMKYDNVGNLIWKRNCWDHGNARAITFDSWSHVYVAGDSSGQSVVSKYDMSGNLIWSINAGAGKTNGIVTYAEGFATYIYFTGDNFIRKYDSSGTLIWDKFISGEGRGIAVDSSEGIHITGGFPGTSVFGTDTLVSTGGRDIFVAEYDASGNCLWARRAGGPHIPTTGFPYDRGEAIVCDANGDSYVTGAFVQAADFGSFNVTGLGNDDIFLARYDNTGNVIWVKVATGGSDEEGRCIALRPTKGDLVVGGSYVPAVDFGSVYLTGWGNYDAFVAKYDFNGNFNGVIKAGGPYWNEYVYGICVGQYGDIYASGSFCGTSYFDSDSLVALSSSQMFVAKIDGTMSVSENPAPDALMKLFPNPPSSVLTIEFESKGETIIELRDILGQIVNSQEISSAGKQAVAVDVSEFSTGLYIIQLRSGSQVSSAKFIKR